MAKIEMYEDHEEFYAEFIRVDGERGTVLIFSEDNPLAADLAKDIAEVIDKEGR